MDKEPVSLFATLNWSPVGQINCNGAIYVTRKHHKKRVKSLSQGGLQELC